MAESEHMQQVHAIVHGKVQGVNFRYYTEQYATSLGLVGWVRNVPDGTVEVIAEGEKLKLERFVAFLRQGPSGARVTSLDLKWWPATGQYSQFRVRFFDEDISD